MIIHFFLAQPSQRFINSDDLFRYLSSGSIGLSFISVFHLSDFHSDVYDIFLSVSYSLICSSLSSFLRLELSYRFEIFLPV